MSTTYEFYVGRKTKEGKIEAIGPYARREDGYHLIPIFERSRSIINWDEFAGCKISPEEFTDEQKEYFTTDVWCGDERYSLATFLLYSDVCSLADDGIEQGYVTLDELDSAAKSGYDPDVLWDIWVRSPEMIAEMDAEERKGYGHIAFIDHCSTGYICRQLINTVDPYDYGARSEDFGFIVRIC